jgi:hypothetical protein
MNMKNETLSSSCKNYESLIPKRKFFLHCQGLSRVCLPPNSVDWICSSHLSRSFRHLVCSLFPIPPCDKSIIIVSMRSDVLHHRRVFSYFARFLHASRKTWKGENRLNVSGMEKCRATLCSECKFTCLATLFHQRLASCATQQRI